MPTLASDSNEDATPRDIAAPIWPDRDRAFRTVKSPSIAFQVHGGLLFLNGLWLLSMMFGPRHEAVSIGALGLVLVVPYLIVGPIVLVAGWRMRNLKSYGLVIVALLLASPLTVFSFLLPLTLVCGWVFLVLAFPNVSASFSPKDNNPR